MIVTGDTKSTCPCCELNILIVLHLAIAPRGVWDGEMREDREGERYMRGGGRD